MLTFEFPFIWLLLSLCPRGRDGRMFGSAEVSRETLSHTWKESVYLKPHPRAVLRC